MVLVEEPQLPPIAEMLRWIEDVVVQGIRRPGYPADRWAEDFIHRAFGSLGLEGATANPDRSRSDRSSASVMFVMTLVEQKMPHSMQSPLHVVLLLESLRPLLGIRRTPTLSMTARSGASPPWLRSSSVFVG